MPMVHVQRARWLGFAEGGLQALVFRLFVTGIAVFLAITIVPGIEAQSFAAGFAAVLVLTLLNMLLRPVLYVLSLPLIVLSLGLFMVLVNALLLQLTAYLVKGFEVAGFWASVWGALLISLVTMVLNVWQVRWHRVETFSSTDRPPRIVNPD